MDDEALSAAYDRDGTGDPLHGLPPAVIETLAKLSVCADCVYAIWTCKEAVQVLGGSEKHWNLFQAYCPETHDATYTPDGASLHTIRWCSRQQRTGQPRPAPDPSGRYV